MFERMAGISLLQVQYKGTGQALIDVVGGQVPLLISSASPVLAYMKSGRLRALAVGSLSRVSFAPSVPTVAESGVPGYEARVWWGIMAPRATPSALVHDISSDIDKAVQSEDVRKKFSNLGIDVLRAKPEVFSKIVAADYKKWAKVIRELEAGAK